MATTGSDPMWGDHCLVDTCNKCGRRFWLEDKNLRIKPENITVNCNCKQ